MNATKAIVRILIMSLLLSCTACKFDLRPKGSEKADYGSPLTVKELNESKLYGNSSKGIDNHLNRTLVYDQKLTNVVGGLAGVGACVVMRTDRNAYVAVGLDHTGHGMIQGGKGKADNRGQTRGMYNTRTGSSYTDPNLLISGVNSPTTVNNHNKLTHRFKQTVAKAVRKADPYVLEVHISANQDFVNQMNVYAKLAIQGENLTPYTTQFNTYVTRVFGRK